MIWKGCEGSSHAYFMVLFQHISGETEENSEIHCKTDGNHVSF
jgi:hypothetical protein